MVQAGHERIGSLEHPLAGHFRSLIAEFGGNDRVADELLSRFQSLEEDEDHMVTAKIYREADNENLIYPSWVGLHFNPHRRSFSAVVYLGGLIKRELSRDILDHVKLVLSPDEGTVVFENDRGRMVWLNKDSTVISTPS